ncbi:aldo-keto reductase family 1 member E1 [Daldinia vernicosa]|uniref:aldo-keto reductase family 1 member E1 n=1 Tax=Daldinia vernicosa TaxID=114800 RepID=UPI0020071E92|nr:aldo-keto reductase family 1 member E1 [Daldinia vernicosa]KAI0848950.1 aldo-keto reductase family 1 member E1 [Daldinia vernicosa]
MSASNFSVASKIKLPNGKLMPQIQLGLYKMSPQEAKASVQSALAVGYRGFDCAQMYNNEREAGEAIRDYLPGYHGREGDPTRLDVFYTSKLASNSKSYDTVRRSIRQSVDACGLGYIDLFLLHSPYGGREARLASWRAVEDAIDEGEVKSGGISNYGTRHLEELILAKPRHPPQVNQIEVHPFNTQTEIRATCARFTIVVEAYAPLAHGMRMKHPTIVELSKKYSCTPAQLMIRWSLQHGLVPLPKSTKRERQIENGQVGGFEISAEDMERMDGLDEKLVTDWDPTDAP